MTNQLALRDNMPIMDIATAFVKSGYFTDVADIPKAVVKIMAGQEYGFGPFSSMHSIHIIQGRPSLGADLMAAAVKRSGRYDYRVREMTPTVCSIEYFERVNGKLESLGVSTFNLEDARKAGTKNLDKFPRNMLFARAMSNGVRWFVPDVFGAAVYTPEELGAETDVDGEVIDIPAQVVTPPTPPPANGKGDKDKQPASEKAWLEWNKLVDRATELGIEPDSAPPDITLGDLRAMYTELEARIKAEHA